MRHAVISGWMVGSRRDTREGENGGAAKQDRIVEVDEVCHRGPQAILFGFGWRNEQQLSGAIVP